MCGIVGYIGKQQAIPVLIEGLRRLEYRGYDSAGIAVADNELWLAKKEGKLTNLEAVLAAGYPPAQVGIGHTRWATHGRPSDANAHPHPDCSNRFAVVHNGIIENYKQLQQLLTQQGHRFYSETDTEVIPHLVEHYYQGDLVAAVKQAVGQLQGSFAAVILAQDQPDLLVAIRQDSPLIIGLGEGENFVASDIPAVLPYTSRTYILNDGELAIIKADSVQVQDAEGQPVSKQVFNVPWDSASAAKNGYPHFMLKEIHEQPRALRDTLSGRVDNGRIALQEVDLTPVKIRQLRHVVITACGTAYHAGLVAKYAIEQLARLPVEVDIASEFRYRHPLIDQDTLVVVVSQSGETADTLAALRHARRQGARVVAVTNVVGSSVAREADDLIYTWAGPEVAVASTKAYLTQLVALYLLAVHLARGRGQIDIIKEAEILANLSGLSPLVEQILQRQEEVEHLARGLHDRFAFFIGRGLDYAASLEGALKVKEISYIHAQAYAAGELKHGTLALIDEGMPVIALATQPALYDKMVSNIREVKARGAHVTAIIMGELNDVSAEADAVFAIPETLPLLSPVLSVVPLQLLAYYAACQRGCDVDQPRNLAKSVTVE